MGKAHRQHIADVAERDERRETTRGCALSEHIPEEQPRYNNLRLGKLPLRNGGKIRDVGEHVQHRDAHDGKGGSNLERTLRVLQLAHDVVGVLPALIAVHHLQESGRIRVGPAAAIPVALLDRPEVVKVVGVRN